MFVLEVLVATAVLAAVALLAAGRFDGLADETPDDPDVGVPTDRPLRSTDVPRLRFRLAIRGYRMSDVDAAMAAVHQSLLLAEARPASSPAPATRPSAPVATVPPPVPPSPIPPTPPSPPPIEPEPLPPSRPQPIEPEPLPPTPPAPPRPEPVPQPEPPLVPTAEPPRGPTSDEPLVPTAEQPPTDAEDQPVSELEAQVSQAGSEPSPPGPTSWHPPLTGP